MVASVVWSEGAINGTIESEIVTPEKYLLDEGAVCLAAAPWAPITSRGICHHRRCLDGQIFLFAIFVFCCTQYRLQQTADYQSFAFQAKIHLYSGIWFIQNFKPQPSSLDESKPGILRFSCAKVRGFNRLYNSPIKS